MATGSNEHADWRNGKTLVQCNRYILEQEVACDIHFIVGPSDNQRRIGAHKSILMARSDVFFTMFEGLMAESSSLITVPDVDPLTFKKMLLYIYCDDTGMDLSEAFSLLYAAQKYNLQGLVKRCDQRMRAGISVENVCFVLMNMVLFNAQETKQLCLEYIYLHGSNVFLTDGFLDLSEECLIEILQNHKVNCSEEKIFEAVEKWTKEKLRRQNLEDNAINSRKIINNILPHIRFARMKPDYFTDKVSHKGILTDSELVTHFRFLTSNKADLPEPHREQRLVFDRFQSVMSGKGYLRGNSDAISFILSEDAKLHQVLVYGSCKNEALYRIKLNALEDGHTVLPEKCYDLRTNGASKTYPLDIIPPILVKADVCYTLSMTMQGPASYFGQQGQSTITKDGVTITFISNPEGLNGTNVKQGQFSSLVFEKM